MWPSGENMLPPKGTQFDVPPSITVNENFARIAAQQKTAEQEAKKHTVILGVLCDTL